jgi:hypothetical protein
VSLLADLQAGLLDDATAAALRRRIRTDPETARTAAALDRVRRDLADLGAGADLRADTAPAGELPEVPAHVTARLSAVLASTTAAGTRTPTPGPAAHAARGSVLRPRTVALVAGGVAALAAVGIGVTTLLHTEPRSRSTGVTADRITLSRPPVVFPLPQDEVLALLDRPADLGALADPVRRAACLTTLGLSGSAAVLGADTVDVGGSPTVVVVLAGETRGAMTALAGSPTCSAEDPGAVAETVLSRAAAAPSTTP